MKSVKFPDLILTIVLAILKDKNKMINRFPGIKDLAHKDVFSSIMRMCSCLSEEYCDFIPPSFSFPND